MDNINQAAAELMKTYSACIGQDLRCVRVNQYFTDLQTYYQGSAAATKPQITPWDALKHFF